MSTSPNRGPMPSCWWCATDRSRWGAWRSSGGGPPWRRGAGWSSRRDRHRLRPHARPRHSRGGGGWGDARLERRRPRRGGASDGGDQGVGRRRPRREPGQPAAPGDGGRRRGRERVLAPAVRAGGPAGRARGLGDRRGSGGRAGRQRRPGARGVAARRGGGAVTTRAVEAWTLQPLVKFAKEAEARLVLVMTSAGQVMAQHGFSRAVEVMAAAAFGAAILPPPARKGKSAKPPPLPAPTPH